MMPKEKTMKVLMGLVSQLVINERTILLYLFYCLNGKNAPTRDEIQKGTGLSLNTIRKHDRVLTELGAITRVKVKGKRNVCEVVAVDIDNPTTPRVLSSIISILNIATQKSNASLILHNRYNNNIGEISTTGYGRFTSELDIANDTDWIAAKVHLIKYFKEYELNLSTLAKKNRFSKLVELLIDESFDFPGYCKWYYDNKYRDCKFNFGLFLYPSLLGEYRSSLVTDGKYLRTSSRMAENESFKAGLKKTKDFLKNLEDEDEK